MPVHPPRPNQLPPHPPEELARLRMESEAYRADHERRRRESRPARLRLLQAGPALRSLDAAVECQCSCHPQVSDLHGGGEGCPCQQAPEERRAAWTELFSGDNALSRALEESHGAVTAAITERAAALGVTAELRLLAAPFVVAGVVDGRGFYLRERHGSYQVTVAGDDDPTADPWRLPPERLTYDVASGEEEELGGGVDPGRAVDVAVDAVRTFLRRRTCRHERAPAEGFCPACGVNIAEAAAWRG